MPIFEQECTKCGFVLETLEPKADRTYRNCVICNIPMIPIHSTANFKLLGKGFYKPSKTTKD